MDTVGTLGRAEEYLGLGGGFKCETCSHFLPIEAVENAVCPVCGSGGLIGTVIMGAQWVTVLYPKGWFDDECETEAPAESEVSDS